MYDLGEQFKMDYSKALPNPNSIIKDNNSKYRFTIITDSLIRIEYNEEGVPVVIDAATIIRDALNENVESAKQIDDYIDKFDEQLIVTSTDIDMIIKEFSDIIAAGINKTIHPGIYS